MIKGIFFNEKDMNLVSEIITNIDKKIDKKIADIVVDEMNNEKVLKKMDEMNSLITELQEQLGLR